MLDLMLALRLRTGTALGVLAVLLVLSGCGTTSAAGDQGAADPGFITGESLTVVPVGERGPVPVLSGPALEGDETISTADYQGQVIVLNVWGSWCAPCREEAPGLAAASKETAEISQFIGINVRDYDKAPAQAFERAFDVNYPSIYDPYGKVLLELGGELPPNAIPTTLVIDTEGRLAARIIGPTSRRTLVAIINDAAAGR